MTGAWFLNVKAAQDFCESDANVDLIALRRMSGKRRFWISVQGFQLG